MFTSTKIKYLHIPLLAKIFREENIHSFTKQNVEEINIAGKTNNQKKGINQL